MKLYDWQQVDALRLYQANYISLLAIEPGGGKTAIAAQAIADSGAATTLILAPNSTIESPESAWPKTVSALAGEEVRVMGNKNKAQQSSFADFQLGYSGVYACTPQLFVRSGTPVSEWRGDLLITDESHGLTSAGKQGQKRWSGFDLSEDDPISNRFGARLALSGSPMRQDFQNMWATMRYLWPDLDSRDEVAYLNYWQWMKDRMTSRKVWTSNKDRFGNFKKVTQYLEESEPGKLFSEMPSVVLHKRREGCCEFHPRGFLSTEAPQEINVPVQLTPKQSKAIHELETHFVTLLEGNPLVTELSITQKQRIRQLCLGEALSVGYWGVDKEGNPVEKQRIEFDPQCKSPFADAVFDILDTLPRGEPVVVYLESQRFAEVMVHKLRARGFTAEEYSGKRKTDLYAFGEDYQILVGVISAMGTGTDGLQERCSTEIFMETPLSLTNRDQVFARLDRLGGQQVQRYLIHDTQEYSEGRYSDLLEKQLRVNASMRPRR